MNALPAYDRAYDATFGGALGIDIALEHELLGMALNEPALAAGSDIGQEHFADRMNGLIWATLCDAGSVTAVASHLSRIPAFYELGGLSFLADLVNKAPPGTQWRPIRARIFEAWRLRRAGDIAQSLASDVHYGSDARTVVARLRSELEALETAGGTDSRFAAVNFHDIEPRPQPWLIKGALPMRGVGFIGGVTKAGKSFLALDITLRLAAGAEEILERRAQACGCVYIAAEDPEGSKYRVKAWQAKHFREGGNGVMPFDLIPQSVNLLDAGAVADLKRALLAAHARFAEGGSRLGVIVIDTLSRCLGGADENSSADMGRAFDVLADIASATGALVLVVAHYGKAGAERGLRGHSLLDANSEATITVERSGDDPDLRIVTLAKVKNGVDGAKLAFRLESVGLGMTDDDGDELSSCVPVYEQVDEAQARKGRALKPPEQLILTALGYVTDHEKTHAVPATIPGAQTWMKAVTRDQVRDRAYLAGLAVDNENSNTTRMRFDRAFEALCAMGKIRAEGRLVWAL